MLKTIIDLLAFIIGAFLIMIDIENQTDIEFTFRTIIGFGLLTTVLI